MADIFHVPKNQPIRQGAAIVRYSDLVGPTGIPPKINQTWQITPESGILDSRFDEVRYYTSSG